MSRELKIHDNLLLFQHLLLLFNCVVTRTIQPAVVVSRVKIFIVEFSSWCPEKLSAIDLSNASLPNVLSHGVFWELFVIVVAEQVIIIQWTRIFVLAIIEVYPVLSADFLLYILIFIVVVLLLGIVGDDGGSDGEGEVRCLEKLRKLVAGRDKENGEMVDAKDVRLLLRPVMLKDGVAGVVLAVQKLLLRMLLPVDDDELDDDELVPLLILRILAKAPLLLTGGLEILVIVSRQICDSGAA